MRAGRLAALLAAISTIAASAPRAADLTPDQQGWNQPVAPFAVADGLYYVGARDISAWLISTPKGLMVLDGGFEQTAPQILANIRTLGFDPRQVKWLLNNHAHHDHAGGLAALKAATGARLVASRQDTPALESGGRGDPSYGELPGFPPVKVDRPIDDGETVSLGGVTLTAHLTAGHTKGCTTWTGRFKVDGRPRDVVLMCSLSVLGAYRLSGDPAYPGRAADYRSSFAKLKALPCEVFLSAHGWEFGLADKIRRKAADPASRPFIDPQGCRAHIASAETAFQARLTPGKTAP